MDKDDLGFMSACKGDMRRVQSRVLLLSPPSGARSQVPPLNLLYLAAEVRRVGAEVRIVDLEGAARSAGEEALVTVVDDWKPQILGVTLCTETALSAYRVLAAMGHRDGMTVVAGGPHATALPEEALDHGFDVVVRGEGEETLIELAAALEAGEDLGSVAGLALPAKLGGVGQTIRRTLLADIDQLASPTDALDLLGTSQIAPTVLTSRGCPGLCTFCANHVFGQKYRCHSVARVIREMESWHAHTKSTVFNFCDAAFTVDRRRLKELCTGLSTLSFVPTWWCEARADQLDDETTKAMATAGCTTVLIGAESGDPGVLARIRKGIDPQSTLQALEVAKTHGLRTEVSFMVGFPDETARELETTLEFMSQIAHVVDVFRPMGIVVPYPGTPLYEQHHQRLGFTQWWLDGDRPDKLSAAMNKLSSPNHFTDVSEMHAEMERAFLEVHPIPYADEVRAAMERCLDFRHAHNRESCSSGAMRGNARRGSIRTTAAAPSREQTSTDDLAEGFFVSLEREDAESANRRRVELLAALDGRVEQAFGQSKPHLGPLSPGCVLCGKGYWSCLFVNGVCNGSCFFCPTEMTHDGYPPAAERVVFESPRDYAAYVRRLGFKGVGLSGGEPFLAFDKTLSFLQTLRQESGDELYIWAYTNGTLANRDRLRQLAEAGLDELRFNVVTTNYSLKAVSSAVGIIPRVTVEIPAIPEHGEQLRRLLPQLAEAGVDHLNLHQLMIVGENAARLQGRDYTFLQGPAPGVMESELLALELMRHTLDEGIDLAFNYCGVAFKERWQYRGDDLRALGHVKRGYETTAESGLLRRFWVEASADKAAAFESRLRELDVDDELWRYDAHQGHLYIHPSLAPLVDGGGAGVRVRYYKTIIGSPETMQVASPDDLREIEVSPSRTVMVGLHRLGPPITLTAAEVELLAAGETVPQVRQFEEVAVGLPAYY